MSSTTGVRAEPLRAHSPERHASTSPAPGATWAGVPLDLELREASRHLTPHQRFPRTPWVHRTHAGNEPARQKEAIMAKGQQNKEKGNKPKLTLKEKKAKKQEKRDKKRPST